MSNQKLYQQPIGSLLYIATRKRPDICAAVNIAARKASAPTYADWTKVKRIMRYLRGKADLDLNFDWNNRKGLPIMIAYSDSDWAWDLSDRKSTSGSALLTNGMPTVWQSKKQIGVVLSSCESEYIALSECIKQVKWARMFLEELDLLPDGPIVVFEDNTGAIKWTKCEKMSKHVETRHYFVKDEAARGTVEVMNCRSERMLADLMTKGLPTHRVEFLREALCIRNVILQSEIEKGCYN